MCDYSLTNVKSRSAKVGDKLVTHSFGTGTTGFRAVDDVPQGHCGNSLAICVLPGTEIAFDRQINRLSGSYLLDAFGAGKALGHEVAIFRQINKDKLHAHHDALELPNGEIVLLTVLVEGQQATVLQLPAQPKTEQEAQDQKRLEVVG